MKLKMQRKYLAHVENPLIFTLGVVHFTCNKHKKAIIRKYPERAIYARDGIFIKREKYII